MRGLFLPGHLNNLEVKFTICWQTVNILEGKYKLSLQMTSPLIIPIGPNLPDDSSVGEIQNIELLGKYESHEIKPNQDRRIGNEEED